MQGDGEDGGDVGEEKGADGWDEDERNAAAAAATAAAEKGCGSFTRSSSTGGPQQGDSRKPPSPSSLSFSPPEYTGAVGRGLQQLKLLQQPMQDIDEDESVAAREKNKGDDSHREAEDEFVSSLVSSAAQHWLEKNGEASELSAQLVGDNADFMETDGRGSEETRGEGEASSRLLGQLEPQQDTYSAEHDQQQQ
ncbi:uncharacterized protein EMH_0035940 [Eimeria mitis]|uniref:Uncharacterized protein n=1 Tax=Eimeria mitis TaxID=44415 RepID=U6JR14_9EIME|nr:uncharacterized protein EMH_0035940 [Eimeria mitis]CDJ27900.1 hypothetical protein EMH_0035940 [Eimeria mitis]